MKHRLNCISVLPRSVCCTEFTFGTQKVNIKWYIWPFKFGSTSEETTVRLGVPACALGVWFVSRNDEIEIRMRNYLYTS